MHVTTKFAFMYHDMTKPIKSITADRSEDRLKQLSDMIFNLADLLGELVLMYRCWTIWHKKLYILIVPCIIWCAFFAVLVVSMYRISHMDDVIAPRSMLPLGTSAFALPLAFNIIVSLLVIGRLWYFSQQQKRTSPNPGTLISLHRALQKHLHNAMLITIEAGLMYIVVQAVLTGLIAAGHPAQLMWSNMAAQIYGIAPTLILVRVGLGHSIQLAGDSEVVGDVAPSQ
ncbi:hypothetical protein AX16_005838 [Volvariella volvacea WC 439]|nr:hypothetical protein AX16_005838 [Volvariella volvacea WC 439]